MKNGSIGRLRHCREIDKGAAEVDHGSPKCVSVGEVFSSVFPVAKWTVQCGYESDRTRNV
jgi:hypothetical protein